MHITAKQALTGEKQEHAYHCQMDLEEVGICGLQIIAKGRHCQGHADHLNLNGTTIDLKSYKTN